MTQLTFSRFGFVFVLLMFGFGIPDDGGMPLLAADEQVERKTIDLDVFARRIITITDLVLRHEIDPPTRQEMILAGTKSLLKKSDHPVSPVCADRAVTRAGISSSARRNPRDIRASPSGRNAE